MEKTPLDLLDGSKVKCHWSCTESGPHSISHICKNTSYIRLKDLLSADNYCSYHNWKICPLNKESFKKES